MIRSITVINDQDEALYLDLFHPEDSSLVITKIDGLGPTKASINTTELASSDGAMFNSSRITSRNIVMSFQLLEDPVTNLIETTRLKVYRAFPLKRNVTIIIETDHRIAQTTGYVETNEPDIFQKQETMQVSIVCPDPFFYTKDDSKTLNGVESQFSFPFSNESLTEPLLLLGDIISSVGEPYYYSGDIQCGVIIHMHAYDEVINPTIYNSLTKERMKFDTSKIRAIVEDTYDNIIAGDDIIISSISGDKYVKLRRHGKEYNILACLPKLTQWITVKKGDNVFGYFAESGSSNLNMIINTNILYEGM